MQFIASPRHVTEKWLFGLTSLIVVVVLVLLTQRGLVNRSQSFAPPLQSLAVEFAPGTLAAVKAVTEDHWQLTTNPVSFGFSEHAHWLRFELQEAQVKGLPGYVEISYPLLDDVDVWVVQNGQTTHYSDGDSKPFAKRSSKYHGFLFNLPDNAEPASIYIKVRSSSVVKVPVKVWERRAFGEYIANMNLVMGVFFGLLLAMGLSNLFFFFTTRNLTFLYYTCYVICLGLTLSTLHGFSYKYLWPEQVWFQSRSVSFLASATLVFAVIFSGSILELRYHNKWFSRSFKLLASAFGVIALMSLVLDYSISIKLFLVLLTITVFMIMGVALWFAYQRISIAGYYALAWSALLISALSASLDNLGVIAIDIPSQVLLVYGASIEALMLAFILAISYSRQGEQILAANQQALQKEREVVSTKQELIELQQRTQDELEYKVQERTLELEIALRELSDVNRELEKLNTIDPLTGIRNRRYFDKRLQAEGRRSRREHAVLALAMIDIDHFKQINDKYGHAAGDACIKHVAQSLKSSLKRPSDDVCRYGGEEFAIILPNTDLAGAVQLIESMRQRVASSPCEFDGQYIPLTLSGGVASGIIAYADAENDLLKHADEQLYVAKQAGRNQVAASSITETE